MVVFLVRLFRVLVVLLVLRFLLGAVAAWFRPRRGPASSGPEATTLVRDRICNTFVPRDRAHRAKIAGRDEFFCSNACRARALADPSRLLTATVRGPR